MRHLGPKPSALPNWATSRYALLSFSLVGTISCTATESHFCGTLYEVSDHSDYGATEGNQTPNLLITNQLHYRCATVARTSFTEQSCTSTTQPLSDYAMSDTTRFTPIPCRGIRFTFNCYLLLWCYTTACSFWSHKNEPKKTQLQCWTCKSLHFVPAVNSLGCGRWIRTKSPDNESGELPLLHHRDV